MQSESRRLLLKALAGAVAATRFPMGFALTQRALPNLKRAEALITHNPLPWALGIVYNKEKKIELFRLELVTISLVEKNLLCLCDVR